MLNVKLFLAIRKLIFESFPYEMTHTARHETETASATEFSYTPKRNDLVMANVALGTVDYASHARHSVPVFLIEYQSIRICIPFCRQEEKPTERFSE